MEKLKDIVNESSPHLTCHQKIRANSCIKNFIEGAPAHQVKNLPAVFVKNSNSTFKNGRLVTDKVATWIKEDIVAGPFTDPPLKNFRVNPLIALEQHGKIRPILNVSEPINRSFNDNVDGNCTEKVFMSSAQEFGYAIVKCGTNAEMSKFDLQEAYKNIPAKMSDLRLQGFSWLKMFFFEKKQVFGAKTSVCNFDIFGHTLMDLAIVKSGVPKNITFRRLDDVPIVSPNHMSWCKDFTNVYKNLCDELNVKLAPDCPNNEKAFSNQKRGRILGIDFDTTDLTWSIPFEKREKCLIAIKNAIETGKIDLLGIQKLMGRLGDLGQLCPFMKAFKKPLNDVLSYLQNNPYNTCALSEYVINDLFVWAGMLSDVSGRYPIPHEPASPPMACKKFISDAAGNAENSAYTETGVGGICLDENGEIILAFQHIWDKEMITEKKDGKGARYGAKTTTLEMIGLVIPFLMIPEKMMNQNLVFEVDNIGCYFGWENKYVKGDITASILVKSILLMSSFLGSNVFVEHLPRVSNWEASVADNLSRRKTTYTMEKKLLKSFNAEVPSVLKKWMKDPSEDWNMPYVLLEYVKSKMVQ